MAPEIIMFIVLAAVCRAAFKTSTSKSERQNIILVILFFIVILIWGNFFNDTLGTVYVKLTKIFN